MSNDQEQLSTIELRELQPLLVRTFGDRLIVVRYSTKNLLQPGENYGSTILSVHAVIKRNNEAEEEDLHLIAKMPPPTAFQREIFNPPYTFRKEIFMYEKIIPSYQELEREMGLKENEVFDILPKYYQSRLSLSPDIDFDDNAVILMENLRTHGYYNGDRIKGCDLEHSRVAIQAMARFHALGMATKYKRPEYFEVLKERSKSIEMKTEEFERFQEDMLKIIASDSQLAVYVDRCRVVLRDSFERGLWTSTPNEPWSTIIHADFWVNNIMFHRDENGRVDDIKFVDFQNYLFFSPLREMFFFLFSSTDVSEDCLEELINLYHETFLAVLDRMGCDTEQFTREKFDAKMSDDARLESMHIFFMLKILTLNVQETDFKYDNMKDLMITYQGNKVFIQRLRKVVLYFVKHDWI
ncbi:uncharacterized protein LOC105204463 [Solenopsis invicta]|uniref:uncharacterized protein LOC105204463 n=1 Tax=Solenopsis invicta TaxID=13686 RepID=UPI000595D040|nr:uncharacterized protein LOC105204463 [Solenopsis invicta]